MKNLLKKLFKRRLKHQFKHKLKHLRKTRDHVQENGSSLLIKKCPSQKNLKCFSITCGPTISRVFTLSKIDTFYRSILGMRRSVTKYYLQMQTSFPCKSAKLIKITTMTCSTKLATMSMFTAKNLTSSILLLRCGLRLNS